MKIITVSTFWNSEKLVKQCIESLKNQYFTNFTAYFIDDKSTDNSYEVAKKTIGDDKRFILIKNKEKKYKTKNFIDVIRHNPKIKWNDVIVEIDGDDKLLDNNVLGLINKTFMNNNVWICGTKWQDVNGKVGNYGKPSPERARKTSWNFSHMRSYRAFLFRSIKDEHLKHGGQYFRAACDLGFGIPMLEMAGSEHFVYHDFPTYVYHWHDKQTYSKNNSFGDNLLQGLTAKYIYSLPQYTKLKLVDEKSDNAEDVVVRKNSKEVLEEAFNKTNHNQLKPEKEKVRPDYNVINDILKKQGVYNPNENQKTIRTEKPKIEVFVFNSPDSINETKKEMFPLKPKRRGSLPNIYGNNQRRKGGFSI
jgi:glycosyltransferase involved in cell wall biosynthesis